MDNKINAWLEDINRSIDEIFDFLPKKRDFFEYQADLKTKKAVERNIEIIGEAINRISKNKSIQIEIKNAQKIIGTRNRIAHEYDNISDELIWTIILRELPKLKKEVVGLMK
ncbi:HepT-like ribonuclease domain-containing protein [Algoriphagus persicinus]|uniref:HepT-like ribonuclease domain-containing protein n=1 Tax=Algoriphagus persicinus TaxID=3108754 RepID=UPI002B3DEA84|nr:MULTISPECIES: HepT-like ribonuclease domain-containing protein [unclassified Algoriphagus]MEB2781767.1 HepT-like ribonuclease domain-containing protein [Algoriphagus sp. C2-6-M1]MEB2786762.1 HepT-like ribonuclease domain-containing protein [Algoriphagus sp. E1-3-M2]